MGVRSAHLGWALWGLALACGPSEAPCFRAEDCLQGAVCRNGRCEGPSVEPDSGQATPERSPDASLGDSTVDPADLGLRDADAGFGDDAQVADGPASDVGGQDAATCAAEADGGVPGEFFLCSGVDGSLGDTGHAPPLPPSFRITSLTPTNCQTFALSLLQVGSDGVIADSPSHIFVDGYAAPWARLDMGFTTDSNFPVYATDLGSTTPFAFGSAGLPVALGGNGALADQLIPLVDAYSVPEPPITLSVPIALTPGVDGIFSGLGELGVLSGDQLRVIDARTGAVDIIPILGPPPAPEACSNGFTYLLTSGVLERFGSGYHLVFRAGPTEVVRYEVATGVTTTLATFSNLGTGCGLSVAPERERWIFTHWGPSQFSSVPDLSVLGVCDASFEYPDGPPAPDLVGTMPPSPAQTTNCPTVVGTAEPGSLVELFAARGCTGEPVAATTADLSGGVQLPVWVPQGSEHQWFTTTRRVDGQRSPCVKGPSFINDPFPPRFVGTSTIQVYGTTLVVRWEEGSDDTSTPRELTYDVFLRPEHCAYPERVPTTPARQTWASLRDLVPDSNYGVTVKVRDRSGRVSENGVEVMARTQAAPTATLRIEGLEVQTCRNVLSPWVNATMAATGGKDHLFVASQPTSMFDLDTWLPGPLPGGYQGGYRQLVQDLGTGRVYALRDGGAELGLIQQELSNQFPVGAAVVTRLVELDPMTGLPAGATVELSSPVQLLPHSALFSGIGRLVIFDGERLNHVDFATGAVTRLGHFPATEIPKPCSFTVGHGVVEDFGGSLHLLYIDGRNHLRRFTLSTGVEVLVSDEYSLQFVCGFDVSLGRGRWYGVSAGVVQTCPLAYSQPEDPPFDAGPATDAGGAPGPLCSNGSNLNCGPAGATYTPFVDPTPPAGFVQCAGFTNTTGDDVARNWMSNCFDSRSGPLWLRVYDDTNGLLLAGARLVEPVCPNTTPLRYRVDQIEADGFRDVPAGECMGPGGVQIYFTGATDGELFASLGNLSELILRTASSGPDGDEAGLVLSNGPGSVRALRVALYAAP